MRSFTRREALDHARALLTGQRGAQPAPPRLVPREDLVNTLEFEEQAARRLPAPLRALLSGSPRESFDRITLRPRMCVPVLDMDLSVTLFGDAHFTPILVGPVENQGRFHPDGERATLRGAAAANAAVVVCSRATAPLSALAAEARTPLWFQVFADDPRAGARIRDAAQAGCRAACITVGAAGASPESNGRADVRSAIDWPALEALVRASPVPTIVKGITTPEAATRAVRSGANALVVSSYRGGPGEDPDSPILTLPDIVDAAGTVPVLADGGFRRGTDIIKALAFGARAVLIGRPVMWGLAAYGADGVQGVIQMLQTELARYMGMCGKSRLASLDRSLVRVHRDG